MTHPIRPDQYRRLALLALLLVVAFAGLGYRLFHLQVTRHEELTIEAAARQKRMLRAPRRGDILDALVARLVEGGRSAIRAAPVTG